MGKARQLAPLGDSSRYGARFTPRPVICETGQEKNAVVICSDGVFNRRTSVPRIQALRIVLTRYNMVLVQDAAPSSDLAAWYAKRLQIFTEFCMPSVLGQTERPDKWLLGFDAEHREAVASVLRATEGHSWIVPVWQSRRDDRHENIAVCFTRELERHLVSGTTHVISTRLDSLASRTIARWR